MKAARFGRHQIGVIASILLAASSAAALAVHDWNDREIAWRSLDDGLREAEIYGRPVCLVIYTETCPHCGEYAQIFHDSSVVSQSQKLVMVKMDSDADRRAARYAPDGSYIPRTIFLSPSGSLLDVHANRKKYIYCFNYKRPDGLLAGMKQALGGGGGGGAGPGSGDDDGAPTAATVDAVPPATSSRPPAAAPTVGRDASGHIVIRN